MNEIILQSFNQRPCGFVWYYVYNSNNVPTLMKTMMVASTIDDQVKRISEDKSFIVFALDKSDKAMELNVMAGNAFKKMAMARHGITTA